MKIGIVLNTNDKETCWNCFRFGNEALNNDHIVSIFLLGRGVEIEDVKDKKYNVQEQVKIFLENKGRIMACGTCLQTREKEASKVCPLSTLHEMLHVIEESEKILTFG